MYLLSGADEKSRLDMSFENSFLPLPALHEQGVRPCKVARLIRGDDCFSAILEFQDFAEQDALVAELKVSFAMPEKR
jgi:hypothetical protein